MVNQVIFVGGAFFAIVIYLALYVRMHNNKRFQMIDWFLLSLATFNGLGFAFVFWASSRGLNSLFWQRYINMYDNYTAIIFLISSFLLGLSTLFGWIFFRAIKKSGTMENIGYYLDKNKLNLYIKKASYVAWIFLIISIVSYTLYSNAYGGFVSLLNYSIAIRSGIMTINNPFSFLQKLGGFAFFSSFIFFGLLIDKSVEKRFCKFCFLGYIISLFFSLYVLYSWVGRVATLVYIGTFILGYILYKYQSVSKLTRKLILVAVFLPVSLIGVDRILGRSSRSLGIIEFFAKELSFPFASYIVQINQNNLRMFKDIIVAPLFILPQRIWSGMFNIEVVSSLNTFIFFSARKGESGITGSIPVDMLTFSNMQAPIFGVVIIGLLWGGILYFLENFCRKIPIRGVQQLIYANLVLNVALLTVLYGDPQHIIIRNFAMIIGVVFMIIFMKFKLGIKR